MLAPTHQPNISVTRRQNDFLLSTSLWLPRAPEDLFPFFADAFNLEEITPPFLQFRVLTNPPIVMRPGTLIDYQLRLHRFPMRWTTRIADWTPPHRFVDEQLAGPYRKWRHEHTFEPAGAGTLMRDRVEYAPPGGRLINFLMVERSVRRIFAYRCQRLATLLADNEPADNTPTHHSLDRRSSTAPSPSSSRCAPTPPMET